MIRSLNAKSIAGASCRYHSPLQVCQNITETTVHSFLRGFRRGYSKHVLGLEEFSQGMFRPLQSKWNRHNFLMMLSFLTSLAFTPSGGRALAFLRSRQKPCQMFWRTRTEGVHASDSSNLLDNVITSPKSATVKKIQSILTKRKKRAEFGQTVVEGPRMVFDLLQNPRTQSLVRQILISQDDYLEHYQGPLSELPPSLSPHIQLATAEIVKSCSDTVTPQGIVSLVDIPQLDLSHVTPKYPFYLLLDGVSDPGNVGTLLRSSLAVGVAGVLLLPGCCDVWNPKAVRSAMGASFQLPIFEVDSWNDAVGMMTNDLKVDRVYAATMIEDNCGANSSRNCPHYDIDYLARPSALVIGGEGNGLSAEVRKALIEPERFTENEIFINAVHVPMQAGIESLNAAVCGSVIMFEYARQCHQAAKNNLT